MSEQRTSYRQIFKATSIFGGVQVYQIFLSIIRSKLVAVLLGAQGMGITGLLLTVTTLISGITGMGLNVSAVRNVAEANQTGNQSEISHIVAVVKKLAWLTGMLGAVVAIVFSPWLSKATFGDTSYILSFVALSVTFVLGSIASGQFVLLQGMRKLSYLAKSNIFGATAGLIVSIPLYYIYGQDGIVPAILLSAVATTFFGYYFGSKIKLIQTEPVSFMQALSEGKDMMRMGIMLSLSGVITATSAYVIRLFINREGSLADVGLYSAGFAIVNTYVGMIFTAMGTDYYPRLAAVSHDVENTNKLVNQQAEMALLILGPILIFFLIVLKWVVVVLYTPEFLGVIDMVQWAVLAIFFKAVTWSMGFIFLAKGESKVFFWNEFIANLYVLGLNMLGYLFYGLEGLGISFLLSYLLSTFQNYWVVRRLYKFNTSIELLTVFMVQVLLSVGCMLIMKQEQTAMAYVYAMPLLFCGTGYSWFQLNKRLNLIKYLKSFLSK